MPNPSPGATTGQAEISILIGANRSTSGVLSGGQELKGWSGLTVSLGLDRCSNAFSFSVPFSEKNKEIFKPYKTPVCEIKVTANGRPVGIKSDGTILTGYVEKTSFSSQSSGKTINIEGRSASGVLDDYSAGPPFQHWNLTFNQFSTAMYRNLYPQATQGVSFATPDTQPLGEISIDIGESAYSALSKLASAQGLYSFPDPGGRLEFKKINTSGSMATLDEENPVLDTIESSFDVTKRFWQYMAIGTYQGNPNAQSSINDYESFFPAIRGRKIEQISKESANISQAANFIYSRSILDSFFVALAVDGWHYKGKLWQPGEMITLTAPGCYIEKPTRLLITEATFSIDESSGQKTSLSVCLPSAFDGSTPSEKELPWVF